MQTTVKTGFILFLMITSLSVFAQKKVQNFTVTRVIKAPAEKVWEVVGDDFGAISKSHPAIISSAYVGGSLTGGEGAERVCYFNEKKTKSTHEKQIEFDAENYRFKAKVYEANGIPMDPEYTYAIYKVESIDASTSKLVIEMNIRTKPAFMGAIGKGKFKKTIEGYALAVDHHVITGETVNKENFKEIQKKYAL